MKRKKIALAMAMAMVLTSVPANALVGYAEEDVIVEDVIMDEGASYDEAAETDMLSAEPQEITPDEANQAEAPVTEALADGEDGAIPSETETLGEESEVSVSADDAAAADDFIESIEVVEEALDTDSLMADNTASIPISSDTERITVPAAREENFTFTSEVSGYFVLKFPQSEDIVVSLYNVYEEYSSNPTTITDGSSAIYYFPVYENDEYLLNINNQSASACAAEVEFSRLQGEWHVERIYPGESCTLRAESAEENLTYSWYEYVNGEKTPLLLGEGESYTNSYTVSCENSTAYYCDLTDVNGFYVTYTFEIRMTSGLKAEMSSEEVGISIGGSTVLSVNASHSSDEHGEIRYQWYKYDSNSEAWSIISNAVSPTLAVSEAGYYECEVKDDIESTYVDADVYVNSNLSVSAIPSSELFVGIGQQVILSIEAVSDAGAGALRYQWRDTDYNDIPGATGTSYTTQALTSDCEISCTVTDGYMYRTAYFDIKVIDISLFQNAPVLSNGGTVTAALAAGGIAAYRIVPDKTAKYAFSSDASEDTYAYLSDENGICLASDDDGGSGLNFKIEYNLVAGRTYYLVAKYLYSDLSGSFNVSMTRVCDHQPSYISRNEPTCVTNGSATARCTICGDVYEDILWANGQHTYGDWVTAQAPTVFANGVSVRTCTVCGAQETAPIAALAPTMTVNATKIPLKVKQSTTKLKVSGLAAGDYVASWKSSNTKIVKVNSKGKLTAQNKTGKANITITLASGMKKTVQVTVQKGAVKTSRISNISKKLTLAKGKTAKLAPVITPITTADKVSYSTSNKKVATVSSKGVITAKGSGKAKITVKSGTKKVVVTVTVPKTAPTGIAGVKSAITLKKGKSTTLKPKLSPKGAEAKITYKSSNKKVATVDSKGKIVAKKKGTAVITVTAGKVKKTCKVTVK